MKTALARKILCLILLGTILILSCLVFSGCSIEKYLEEGNFEKAYERALKEENKALQEEILWKNALYGAINGQRTTVNSSDVICAAYYLICIDTSESINQFIVFEYEDVLSRIGEGYRYYKYELYSYSGSGWQFEGQDSTLWHEARDYNHRYMMEIKDCFSSVKDDIDISYVVNNGKKFTADEIKQIRNMHINNYKPVNRNAIDTDVSFAIKEEAVDVTTALQGKWDMNQRYTWGYLVCYINGDTYRLLYEDSTGSPALDVWGGAITEGTITIEKNRIIFTTQSGLKDFELLYQTHRGNLIMFIKEDTNVYRCITRIN